jgi:hypothetical protein
MERDHPAGVIMLFPPTSHHEAHDVTPAQSAGIH